MILLISWHQLQTDSNSHYLRSHCRKCRLVLPPNLCFLGGIKTTCSILLDQMFSFLSWIDVTAPGCLSTAYAWWMTAKYYWNTKAGIVTISVILDFSQHWWRCVTLSFTQCCFYSFRFELAHLTSSSDLIWLIMSNSNNSFKWTPARLSVCGQITS